MPKRVKTKAAKALLKKEKGERTPISHEQLKAVDYPGAGMMEAFDETERTRGKGLIESARSRARESQDPEPQKKKRKGRKAAPREKWSRKKRDKYDWDPNIPFAYIAGGGA
jgi:hypothetical protein